jgi:hypothetical protein
MDPASSADTCRSLLYRVLEKITAGVLLLVIVALGWIIVASFQPDWGRGVSTEVVILALLGAALVLVSILALVQTRS